MIAAWRLRRPGEDGIALIVVLMAISLLGALGTALVLTSMIETRIAATYRDGVEGMYAAEAIAEQAMQDVGAEADWNAVLDGRVTSAFVDGPPRGLRRIGGGAVVDLDVETNLVRCGRPAVCSAAEVDAVTAERPWGRNNPRWQLYAYGPLADLLPAGAIESPFYVVVWVGDDPAERDDNPWQDGADAGKDIVTILSRAYGPRAVMRSVEATVSRDERRGGAPELTRVISWRLKR